MDRKHTNIPSNLHSIWVIHVYLHGLYHTLEGADGLETVVLPTLWCVLTFTYVSGFEKRGHFVLLPNFCIKHNFKDVIATGY